MKYIVIGTFDNDSLESFLSMTLRQHGICHELDLGRNTIVKYRLQIQNSIPYVWDAYVKLKLIVKLRKKESYNVVFVVMRDLNPCFLHLIRSKMGDPIIVNVNPDQMTTLGNMYSLSSFYDYIFLKDRYLISRLSRIGVKNCFPWTECYPSIWNLQDRIEMNNEVVIFGNIYYYRHLLIERLLCELPNVKFRIYGTPSRHVRSLGVSYTIHPPIFGDLKLKVISSSAIVINNLHFAEVDSANNKFFEIVGAGGLVLNERNKEMERLLGSDLDWLLWDDLEMLVNKVQILLDNEPLRSSYRSKLNRFRHSQLWTYETEVKKMLSVIFE